MWARSEARKLEPVATHHARARSPPRADGPGALRLAQAHSFRAERPGWTPLHFLCKDNRTDAAPKICRALLAAGADPRAAATYPLIFTRTPLVLAAQHSPRDTKNCVQPILEFHIKEKT